MQNIGTHSARTEHTPYLVPILRVALRTVAQKEMMEICKEQNLNIFRKLHLKREAEATDMGRTKW